MADHQSVPVDKIRLIKRYKEYIVDNFTEGDWIGLGALMGNSAAVKDHPSLLDKDDYYSGYVTEVLIDLLKDEDSYTKMDEILELDD